MGRKNSYHFGPYLLNANESVLVRDGVPVALTPKAFDTLIVLVRNSGHLVEKEQLMKEVWPETAVEDANLTQNIFTLRRILGDNDEGLKYIETVPRRGYRFVAPVREISEPEMDPVPKTGQVLGQDSVAVLPFVNASGDMTMEHLSDGITVSIINNLSQLPMLRVMSQTAVFRYKGKEQDAQQIGRELGVAAVLVGRIHSHEGGLLISAELVDVANGWQLWGETYDHPPRAIQNEIGRQISAALKIKFTTGKRSLSNRFTESHEAYQYYLQGRYHWSRYTRGGMEEAIAYFRKAIDHDPTYALAYAGIIDCYLRLATNYLPPKEILLHDGLRTSKTETLGSCPEIPLESLRLRYEWDQKAAERELKRATELKCNYPSAYQWYAALQFSYKLFQIAHANCEVQKSPTSSRHELAFEARLAHQFESLCLTTAEEIQIYCTVAREQIDAGNYEAACAVLQQWWTFGELPKVEGLSADLSADLLYTAGALAGCVASTRQLPRGQKHAEALLSASIALFEQLGAKMRAAEARTELAYCYYREGLYDLARNTLRDSLKELSSEERELRSAVLVRSAVLERHAGCPREALVLLQQAAKIIESTGPWLTGRYHFELATTLKELAIADSRKDHVILAIKHFEEGLYKFKAVGNHRYAASLENNFGYLLLTVKDFDEAEDRLLRARTLFDCFGDKVRTAQVDDTLAQLHLAVKRFDLAYQTITRSVATLEAGGEGALLAESLTTQGVVLCKLGRRREAKRVLDRANRVAESCDYNEGAGRALLIIIEEMSEDLDYDERLELGTRIERLLGQSQQRSIRERLRECRRRIF